MHIDGYQMKFGDKYWYSQYEGEKWIIGRDMWHVLYVTKLDPQILVMWTGSSSNVAKYLSDTITDLIRIFISHDPVEECSNNYI